MGGWVHQAKQYLDGMKSELDRDLNWSEMQRETRESFQAMEREAREAADPSRAAAEDAGATGRLEEGQAVTEDTDAEAAAREEAAQREEQAAADMERELEQEDEPESDHRQDGKERG